MKFYKAEAIYMFRKTDKLDVSNSACYSARTSQLPPKGQHPPSAALSIILLNSGFEIKGD